MTKPEPILQPRLGGALLSALAAPLLTAAFAFSSPAAATSREAMDRVEWPADAPVLASPFEGQPDPEPLPNRFGSQEGSMGADGDPLPYPATGAGERLAAIQRGLRWLSTRQGSRDGSLEVGDAGKDERAPLAVTSLAALAWMSGGSTPTRGPYQENVRRAIEYLLANTHRSTDRYPGYIEDREDTISRTHGHGLATLALAQAYTMSPRSGLGKRIETALKSAVRRIEQSQGAEGGWYYDPFATLQHEGSVTVSLVQALRAAKDVGVQVDSAVVKKAVEYMKRLQVMERAASGKPKTAVKLGGFRYGLNDPQTSIALTAAGLATLQASGIYEGPRIQEGYDYVWRELLSREDEPLSNAAAFPYYERFYLSQALWNHRDTKHYRRWAEPIMEDLVREQNPTGEWEDVRYAQGRRVTGRYGSAYATACNVLFLVLPDDSLPLFHR